jgi:hypothetical protein
MWNVRGYKGKGGGVKVTGSPPGARHLPIDNDHCGEGVAHTDHPLDVPGFSKKSLFKYSREREYYIQ